ncbi:MAG: GMC family oxidoreductase [Pseudomonadota bacterium]
MSGPDVLIIGSGMGGATMAAALATFGRQVLVIERGERLDPSAADRDPAAIFRDGHFRPDETWIDAQGTAFNPGNYYNVGGNSKFYGCALLRYRREDFAPIAHLGGTTPGWPIGYDDLECDYQAAEELYQVRGSLGADPTEPEHSGTYPHPPVPHEPDLANLSRRLSRVGLTPSPIPLGLDLDAWLAGGSTTWDAFPGTEQGKMDAESCALRAALAHPNVTLQAGTRADRIIADKGGRITGVEVTRGDRRASLEPRIVVLAAGAVQSAALLLKSANDSYPMGLANSSDQVGRNFMNHNCSAVLALHPLRRNCAVYQKTLMANDFYLSDGAGGPPLGNIQMLGKITPLILAAVSGLPRWLAGPIARRSFDFYAMSEDLPHPESRVSLVGSQIKLDWRRSNWETHERLVAKLKSCLRRGGFPIILSQAFDRRTPSHQCGTARMGADPATSVVDRFCRSHDHPNLYIADASVLPTSAAVNPGLTVAALALRAGRHVREQAA